MEPTKSIVILALLFATMESMAQETLTIAFSGDVMLGRGVNEVLLQKGPKYPWGNLLNTTRQADIFAINLECVISDKGSPWVTTPKVFHFQADPVAIDSLKAAGVDYVSLANNHSLDYDLPAMLDMLERLERASIPFAGSGRNLAEASKPVIIDKKGYKIAFLSFTDNMSEWEAKENVPGVNYIPINLEPKTLKRVQTSIHQAKEQGADLIVFSAHWGPNMRTSPSKDFQAFAHRIMDMGVDIFHGHSAHVFQGIEIYKGKPILYDTGDLIDDYYVSEHIDEQNLYFLHFSGKKLKKIEIIPVKLDYATVHLATGQTILDIFQRLQKRSAPFGTNIRHQKDRFVIDIP